MARNFSSEEHKAGLTLVVKPIDDPDRPVDAEQFLQAATKWLASLSSFASGSGLHVRWEIAELKRSSALLEVIPVDIRTGIIANSVAKDWKRIVKEIETTGIPPKDLNSTTIRDMEQFSSTANGLSVVISAGEDPTVQPITVSTQKRLKEAIGALPSDEYIQEGTIRGRLAVLNSWNPEERWFRLRIPLAPEKQVRCAYADEGLISDLGDTFEKLVDVTGLLHYKKDEIWPSVIEVRSIRKLPELSLSEFLTMMRPIPTPDGMDSVKYIRSLRDGE
ncbi:hypothetical protein [Granulicella sp. dw_53]|uniref:hypothetical protein n=1 Tax=Granulicella sp. dw_53 TaxID=2719792 RepID=UPI001BD4FCC9|nr:hypothetical protein [Granulicella sp. dw_53]